MDRPSYATLSFVGIGSGSRGRTRVRIALELGHRLTAIADPCPADLTISEFHNPGENGDNEISKTTRKSRRGAD